MPNKHAMRDVIVVLPGITGSILESPAAKVRPDRPVKYFRGAHCDNTYGLLCDTYGLLCDSIEDAFKVTNGLGRLSNRVAAPQLGTLVKERLTARRAHSNEPDAKVIVIAHSLGGPVAQYWLNKLAYVIFQLLSATSETVNPWLSRSADLTPSPSRTSSRCPVSVVRVPILRSHRWVATLLSARVLGSVLTEREKSTLIGRLVPAVRTNATLLDTVLARLDAASPAGLDLNLIETSSPLIQTMDPSGGFEFGVH